MEYYLCRAVGIIQGVQLHRRFVSEEKILKCKAASAFCFRTENLQTSIFYPKLRLIIVKLIDKTQKIVYHSVIIVYVNLGLQLLKFSGD